MNSLTVLNKGAYCATFFVCAHCKKPLTAPGWQVAIWDMSKDNTEVWAAHKGACTDAIEQRISAAGGLFAWDELDRFLANLLNNSGYKTPKAGTNWDLLGTVYGPGPALEPRKGMEPKNEQQ